MATSPSAKQKLEGTSQGSCSLLDLPLSVLYDITKQLDMRTQRSLFMSSAQLYTKWHLQPSALDPEWHFFSWSLDLLQQAASKEGYDMDESGVFGRFVEKSYVHVSAGSTAEGLRLTCESHTGSIKRRLSLPRLYLSQDDLFRALVGGPCLLGSKVGFISAAGLEYQQLKHLAKHMFNLMKQTRGYLFLHMDEALSDDADIHEFYDMDTPTMSLMHDNGKWEIDAAPCTTNPPVLKFDKMPTQVNGLEAIFYSPNVDIREQGKRFAGFLVEFDADCELKREFAYNGNVDFDAWAKE